jgi:hypothetical protein
VKNKAGWQLAASAGLFIISAVLCLKFIRSQREPENMAYFYDLSERKLFAAPRTSIPPIRGLNDSVEDAVRAIVISTNGKANDPAARKIAYLEMYSPQLKLQFEGMRAASSSNLSGIAIGHGSAQAHILVRRVEDSQWYSAASPEAQRIMTEWQRPADDGKVPAICLP